MIPCKTCVDGRPLRVFLEEEKEGANDVELGFHCAKCKSLFAFNIPHSWIAAHMVQYPQKREQDESKTD